MVVICCCAWCRLIGLNDGGAGAASVVQRVESGAFATIAVVRACVLL